VHENMEIRDAASEMLGEVMNSIAEALNPRE